MLTVIACVQWNITCMVFTSFLTLFCILQISMTHFKIRKNTVDTTEVTGKYSHQKNRLHFHTNIRFVNKLLHNPNINSVCGTFHVGKWGLTPQQTLPLLGAPGKMLSKCLNTSLDNSAQIKWGPFCVHQVTALEIIQLLS